MSRPRHDAAERPALLAELPMPDAGAGAPCVRRGDDGESVMRRSVRTQQRRSSKFGSSERQIVSARDVQPIALAARAVGVAAIEDVADVHLHFVLIAILLPAIAGADIENAI